MDIDALLRRHISFNMVVISVFLVILFIGGPKIIIVGDSPIRKVCDFGVV
jgi:hypothetical protein